MSDMSIFGKIQITDNKDANWMEKFDRISVDGAGRLLFISVLADSATVKGIGAFLNTDKNCVMTLKDVRMKRASEPDSKLRTPNGQMGKLEGGYGRLYHRYPHGVTHAMFFTRKPGLMLAMTDAHLWNVLTQPEFTTPIIPDWLPWLREELMDRRLLAEGINHRCDCGFLSAKTKELDDVVSHGLRSGKLTIPANPNPSRKEMVA